MPRNVVLQFVAASNGSGDAQFDLSGESPPVLSPSFTTRIHLCALGLLPHECLDIFRQCSTLHEFPRKLPLRAIKISLPVLYSIPWTSAELN
jgi:hypothetical protein